jgi:ABC-2 type transport system ATP-binding protein
MLPAISFDAVTKAFDRKTESTDPSIFSMFSIFRRRRRSHVVLNNFTLRVEPGEKWVVIGNNGAGKTTLLKLAAGLIPPDRGEIRLHGQRISRKTRSLVGVMLSNQFLHRRLTGYENLEYSAALYGCDGVRRRIQEASDRWGLAPYLHERVETYSNGMKTLLALARATIHQPPLIFLDEPSAFLNVVNVQKLQNFLRESTSTVILTTNQPSDFNELRMKEITL